MKFISRSDLSALLDELAGAETLIAPGFQEGVLLYKQNSSSDQIVWDYIRPALSVKEAFFPATDRLLTIRKSGQELQLSETLPEGKQVIFGVRPCDARGMRVLDAMFRESGQEDPYYARRRENTTLVGLACRQMADTCFCTSMGIYPDDPQDVDVMLTETEEGFLVQTVTEKGQALIGEHVKTVSGQVVVPPLVTQHINNTIPSPNQIDWRDHYQDSYWAHVGDRCLSCRICGYVCPTCRCFIVRDEAIPGNGNGEFDRIRCWDTCTSEAYRRIAGGHNPRAEKAQRIRNRFMCKFYYYPEQYGPQACTGCGRCIELCPVNIDITEVLQNLAEVSS
jgi:ferredoxin